jgi:4a-hydroxytetrahydrobiopterin dehydratase
MPDLLTKDQIESKLEPLDGWRLEGKAIVKQFELEDFEQAMDFVNKVAAAAEEAGHHPDIDIRWNKVTLSLTTHARGGLTENDFKLAKSIEDISI